jgi:hypothetical protein
MTKAAKGRPRAESFMRPEEYRATISELGLNTVTAAKFLCIGRSTSFRYASGHQSIPFAVAELLRLMKRLKIRPTFPPDRPRRRA